MSLHRFSRCLFIGAATFLVGAPLNGAVFNVASGNIGGLKAAITTANTNGQDDVIHLASDGIYALFTVDNSGNGLPLLLSDGGHQLTIIAFACCRNWRIRSPGAGHFGDKLY